MILRKQAEEYFEMATGNAKSTRPTVQYDECIALMSDFASKIELEQLQYKLAVEKAMEEVETLPHPAGFVMEKLRTILTRLIEQVRGEEQYSVRVNGERQCVVCDEYIYWPEIKTLPPACDSHKYSELIEEIEPLPKQNEGEK